MPVIIESSINIQILSLDNIYENILYSKSIAFIAPKLHIINNLKVFNDIIIKNIVNVLTTLGEN